MFRYMTKADILSAVAAATLAGAPAYAVTDTIEAPSGFFVPTDAQKYDSPYYRYGDEDWGWTHNAIAGTFTTATLNISAFDVDFDQGEVDLVYAYDNGVAVLLGSLAGGNDIYSFTEFVLGANFFDDIAAGLQVFVNIDSNNGDWALTLAKSSLVTDGTGLPPPEPGVPEPTTWAMMILGMGLTGMAMRRSRAKVAFA